MPKSETIKLSLREEIRTKSMWQLMVQLTPVAVIAMSINSINTFVDALFVGQFLGEKALAAISLAFPLSILTNAFAAMLGVGGASLLSISIGSKDETTQGKIFGTISILAVIFSLALMCFGWLFAEDMIAAIGGEGEVLSLGTAYYQTLILGAFFQICAVAMNFLIRAEGKLKMAMTMSMVTMITNMILNPIFIGHFGWGIEGAAIATIFAMFLFWTFGLIYFRRKGPSYQIDLSYFKLEKALVKPILAVGVSAMMLQMMFFIKNVVVFKMISIYGDDWDIAFMGACYRIIFMVLVPGIGFSSAVQPVIGINYGAGDYKRVRNAFFTFGFGCIALTTTLLIIFEMFPAQILSLLLPDAVFTATDIFNFRIMMAPTFISSFFIMGIQLYQSIGQAKTSGIVTILREIVFFVPVVIVFPIWFGITGIYAAPIVQNVIVFFMLIYLIKQLFSKWKLEEVKLKLLAGE